MNNSLPPTQNKNQNRRQLTTSASSPKLFFLGNLDFDRELFSKTEDRISARIINLENRLKSCDSVYHLSVQAQNIRQKERKKKIRMLSEKLDHYSVRLTQIERKVTDFEQFVQQIIGEEVSKIQKSQNNNKIFFSQNLKNEMKREANINLVSLNSLQKALKEQINQYPEEKQHSIKRMIAEFEVMLEKQQKIVNSLEQI